jgi:hypothetical protein
MTSGPNQKTIPALFGALKIERLAGSVASTLRIVVAVPAGAIGSLWLRPKAVITGYIDLWTWDQCDP